MNTIIAILLETVILLIIAVPATYLVWKLSRTKKTFGEFADENAYGIAYSFVIGGAIIFGLIRTLIH